MRALAAFRYRNFTLFWVGALVSNVGTWMQNATVPYVLYVRTGRASWVGIATFAQFIPSVALSAVGGALADRYPRRSVLLVTQGLAALVALALWGLWVTDHAGPVLIVFLVACGGTLTGLMLPAWQAFVTELVDRDSMLNAVSLNSVQFNLSRGLGPMIAGVVLARWGPSWSFLANAMSFVAVVGALVLIEVAPLVRTAAPTRVVEGFVDAVRYLRGHAPIRRALTFVFIVAALGNPVVPLTAVVVREVYDRDAEAYGLMAGLVGVGAVIGALVLGTFGTGARRSKVYSYSLAGYALALLVLGLSRTYELGLVVMLFVGAGYVILVSVLNTTVQLLVSEDMRGRVLGLYVMAFTAGFPLGSLIQAWAADRVGVSAVITTAASILLTVALVLVARPALTEAFDQEPDTPPLVTPAE